MCIFNASSITASGTNYLFVFFNVSYILLLSHKFLFFFVTSMFRRRMEGNHDTDINVKRRTCDEFFNVIKILRCFCLNV